MLTSRWSRKLLICFQNQWEIFQLMKSYKLDSWLILKSLHLTSLSISILKQISFQKELLTGNTDWNRQPNSKIKNSKFVQKHSDFTPANLGKIQLKRPTKLPAKTCSKEENTLKHFLESIKEYQQKMSLFFFTTTDT